MNAIILAAGLGSRFNEITKNNHKALLPIGNIPNIERTIQYLHEFGVKDITIVVGHMHHLFEYLIDKYQVKLVYNDHYADYNNLYSFYQAIDSFDDTIMIDADVVLLDNIFKKSETSCYYTVQREVSEHAEWCPIVEEGKVIRMDITTDYKPSMLGISYWNHEDCMKIRERIHEKMKNSENYINPKYYWDNIPIEMFEELTVTTLEMNPELVDEMDTVENYQDICIKFERNLNKAGK